MKFLKSSAFKIALSAILLFLVFRLVGVKEVYASFLSVNLAYLLISLVFVFVLILLKAMRWRNIAAALKAHISLADSIKYTLISFAFGFVTPGRVGEFIKTKYLADKSQSGYFKSFLTVVIDKFFDVIASLGLASLGIAFMDIPLPFSDFLILPFALYMLVLASAFLFFDKALKIAKYFAKRLIPKKYRDNLKSIYITKELCFSSLGMSFLIWVFLSVTGFFVLKSLGVSTVSLLVVIVAIPLMALSSMLPISLGGIGIREFVAISFFSFMGITAEKSTAFSLIYTFVTMAPAIIGAILYVKVKAKKKQMDPD